jgi:hypothetical protein
MASLTNDAALNYHVYVHFFFMEGINRCVHDYGRNIHESIQKSHIKFNVRNYIIN